MAIGPTLLEGPVVLQETEPGKSIGPVRRAIMFHFAMVMLGTPVRGTSVTVI